MHKGVNPALARSHKENRISQFVGAGPVDYENGFRGDTLASGITRSRGMHSGLSEYCCCDESLQDLLAKPDKGRSARTHASFKQSQSRRSHYDNLVPYPYDVTRFGDVMHGNSTTPTPSFPVSKEEPRSSSSRGKKAKSVTKTSTPSTACTVALSKANSYFASDCTSDSASPVNAIRSASRHDVFAADGTLPSPIPRLSSSHKPFAESLGQKRVDETAISSQYHPSSSGQVFAGATTLPSFIPLSHNSFSSSQSRTPSSRQTLTEDTSPVPRSPSSHDSYSSSDDNRLSFSTSDSHNLSSSGRSLRDVTASLEDKVFFLRQGKQLVNRKIREAREEEMLRQQQKLRFQRLLDIHRKQILLETLQDLRHRLESQSARLQASYTAVLDIQKRYA